MVVISETRVVLTIVNEVGIALTFAGGNFDGLLFEPVAEFVVDFADDFGAGALEVGIGLGGFVNQNEGGFFIDTEAVKRFSGEVALFEKPGGIDFDAV